MWRAVRWIGVVLVAVGALYLLVLRPMERMASGTRATLQRGLDQVLGAVTNSSTRIVEGRAEIAETSEISELSLLEMRMNATRVFENEGFILKYLPAGTKKLIVRGDYRVKAGYRLKPGISLRLEDGKPVARFPRAEVLSVELLDFQVLGEENSWLNRVTPADRAQVVRELREQMRQEAERSGILDTAESSLRTRLRDLLGVDAVKVEEAAP